MNKTIYTIRDLPGNTYAWASAKSENEAINRVLMILPSPLPPGSCENRWKADVDPLPELPQVVVDTLTRFTSVVIRADDNGRPGTSYLFTRLNFNLHGRIQAEQYLDGDGHYCPVCSSDDIEAAGPFDEESCSRLLSCANCDHQWREIWQLVGITDEEGHSHLPKSDWLTIRPYQSGAYWVSMGGETVELGYFDYKKMTLRINGIELPLPSWSKIDGWRGPINIPTPMQKGE